MLNIGRRVSLDGRLLETIFSKGRLEKNLLLTCMAIGFILFFPNRHSPHFHPYALYLVAFPALMIFFSWNYLRLTAPHFKLVSRSMPQTCLENEVIEIKLQLSYSSVLPFAEADLVEDFPAVDIMTGPEIILNSEDFEKDESATYVYKVRVNRGFGTFKIGPTRIKIRDPFGFFKRIITFEQHNELKVWLNPPPPEDLDLIKENALTPMGDSRSTQSGQGMDFYGIKEYVIGDDVKAMSWLKTAQTGKPVIKQFERDTHPEVLIALHTDKTQLKGFGFGNTMKRILPVSAAIMAEARKQGLSASMILDFNDNPIIIKPSVATPVYGLMTDLFHELKPAQPEALEGLCNMILQKANPGTIVIFLSQTINLDLDTVLNTLISLKARGTKASLWALDDSKQIRFSQQQNDNISKEELKNRLSEIGLNLQFLSAIKAKKLF